MNDLEIRQQLYTLIKDNKLEDEVWLTLSMSKVKEAIEKKGGVDMKLLPSASHPGKIRAGMMVAVEEVADLIMEKMQAMN